MVGGHAGDKIMHQCRRCHIFFFTSIGLKEHIRSGFCIGKPEKKYQKSVGDIRREGI